jgi:hypothetical protein
VGACLIDTVGDVLSRMCACPACGDPSHTYRAFFRRSRALMLSVQTEWKIAASFSMWVCMLNIPCLSYWFSCRYSDSCHSSQLGVAAAGQFHYCGDYIADAARFAGSGDCPTTF